jgi:hypothetical protein
MDAHASNQSGESREGSRGGAPGGLSGGTPGLRSLILKDTAGRSIEIHLLIEDHEEDPRGDNNRRDGE